jgi:hypothetical protein
MMGHWFTPNVVGGAQERRPGGRLRAAPPQVDRETRLKERLADLRAEVAHARTILETHATAANFADMSLATKAARAGANREPKQSLPRADMAPLDAFFERQAKTTNEAIGSFAEWDEEGNRLKGLARMPRMPDLVHKLKINQLGLPLSVQQQLSTKELQRQAFAEADVARNAETVQKKRAIFMPVLAQLDGKRAADISSNSKLEDALRKLRNRVGLVEQEREIVRVLNQQPKCSSMEHGEWWERQKRERAAAAQRGSPH